MIIPTCLPHEQITLTSSHLSKDTISNCIVQLQNLRPLIGPRSTLLHGRSCWLVDFLWWRATYVPSSLIKMFYLALLIKNKYTPMYSVTREKSLKTALAPRLSPHVPEYLIKAVTEYCRCWSCLGIDQSVLPSMLKQPSNTYSMDYGLSRAHFFLHVSREGFSKAF